MKLRETRRFTIADVMILVVAAAVGSLCVKAYLPGFSRLMSILKAIQPAESGPVGTALHWLSGPGSCVVVPLMLATIALRFRQPRPRWRRIARQPGFVACFAAAISLIPGLLRYLPVRHRPGYMRPGAFDQVLHCLTYWTNEVVIGAWLALLLTRKWRATPDWVDRFGRLLGAYWIFVWSFAILQTWLLKLWAWIS